MTQSLTNVQIKEFESRIKHAYQAGGMDLFRCVRTITGVIGNQIQFPKMGTIIANRGAYLAAANPQDPNFTAAVATLYPYYADSVWSTLQQLTVNFSVQEALVQDTSMAFKRRFDQVLIDEWAIGAGYNIGIDVGGNQGFNYEKWNYINRRFMQKNVPPQNRWILLSPAAIYQLMQDARFINRLYLDQDIIAAGNFSFSPVLGMNVRWVGDMEEGGLPLVGTTRTAFAWHTDSTGMGIGQDVMLEVNKIPLQHAWMVTGSAQMGATVIDSQGVISVQYNETYEPPFVPGGAPLEKRSK